MKQRILQLTSDYTRFLNPLFSLVLVCYFGKKLLQTGDSFGTADWDQASIFHLATIESIASFGQLPFWNPWYCGGNDLWANPQVALLSPIYIFMLMGMSFVFSSKLNFILHLFIGLWSFQALLQRVFPAVTRPLAFVLAGFFVFSGAHVAHFIVGHTTFTYMLLAPTFVLFLHKAFSMKSRKHIVHASLVLIYLLANGASHAFFIFLLIASVYASLFCLMNRNIRPLSLLLVTFFLGALGSAFKMMPAREFVQSAYTADTRKMEGVETLAPRTAIKALTQMSQPDNLTLKYGWHEYATYLGWPIVIIFILAAGLLPLKLFKNKAWPRVLPLLFTILTAYLLALGDHGPFSPFSLLKNLPLYEKFRVPSRYLIAFSFLIPLVIAACIQLYPDFLDRRRCRIFILILFIGALADPFFKLRKELENGFQGAIDEYQIGEKIAEPPALDTKTSPWVGELPMYTAFTENRSLQKCYDPFQKKRHALRTNSFVNDDDGKALSFERWGPSQMKVTWENVPALMILEQNFSETWRCGPSEFFLLNERNTCTVHSAANSTIHYQPKGLVTGAVLSLIYLLVITCMLFRRKPT